MGESTSGVGVEDGDDVEGEGESISSESALEGLKEGKNR